MFKITNNRIYLNKGDTPTYDSSILYRDGSPFRISNTIDNPYIEFVVRPSIYAKEDQFSIRYLFPADDYTFDQEGIEEYSLEEFDDSTGGTEGILYRAGTDNYAYWVDTPGEWVSYTSRLSFVFDRDSTKDLEPRTYYYQINLLGGILGDDPNYPYSNITYKKTLLDTSEFKVGGSLSE